MNTTYTPRQLHRYNRYPKLYAERKHPPPPHPSSQPTLPFRLMALPLELRHLIYNAALTLPFPIELWPETCTPLASHQLTTSNRNMQYLRAKMRQHGVNLSLLRVNRMVRQEATRSFYRENEWRFSGMNGWMVASAFLFTTSMFGWQWIRCITLPFPVVLSVQGRAQQRRGAVRPAVSRGAVVKLGNEIPFTVHSGWEYKASVGDVCCALGKCVNLRVVRMVLPTGFDMDVGDDGAMREVVGRIERLRGVGGGGLKVQLVRLSEKMMMAGDLVMDAKQGEFVKGCAENGWVVKTARCDKFGRFDVGDE